MCLVWIKEMPEHLIKEKAPPDVSSSLWLSNIWDSCCSIVLDIMPSWLAMDRQQKNEPLLWQFGRLFSLPLRLAHPARYRHWHEEGRYLTFQTLKAVPFFRVSWQKRKQIRSFISLTSTSDALVCASISLPWFHSCFEHGPVFDIQPAVRFISVHTGLVWTVGLSFLCFLGFG